MAPNTSRIISSILFRTKSFPLQNPNPKLNILPFLISHSCSLSSSADSTDPNPSHRTRTPLEKQFETWLSRLRPGFTAGDVDAALRCQSDPDLAFDIFRWTALQPGYCHSTAAYHTMLQISVSSRRFSAAEHLVGEILSGACPPDPPLLNCAIRFCCSRRHLFSRSFDIYKLMLRHSSCRPNLETYSLLLSAILKRFGKPPICYIYLRSVRSLVRHMKSAGIVADTFTLNLIIKAFSICLEMDEAMRFYREMELYGCEPNEYTYGYITKGFCEKGLVEKGFKFFKEMSGKGFVPTNSVYMALICSLAMEGRLDDGIKVLFDMLDNSMAPDILTYRTVLEGMCRGKRTEEAFELLEELGRKKGAMDRKMYSDLLDGLHWLQNPQD